MSPASASAGAAGAETELFRRTFAEAILLHQQVEAGGCAALLEAAGAIVVAIRGGGKLLLFGNGGSAADAQHVAAELVGRYQRVRRGLPAMALTADTSVVTAVANDEGYGRVFARQIEAFGQRGDVAFGISTSGASGNVVTALATARAQGLTTIALTGRDGGPVGRAADIHVSVPSEATPRVQEVHRTLLHVLCDLVESAFA